VTRHPATYALVTLGCPKNEADADRLAGLLASAGHRAAALGHADLVVVNTCAFIDAAKAESIAAILAACAAAHERGARVAAVGCLVERYRDELATEIPEVDLLCGFDVEPLVRALDEIAGQNAGKGGHGAPEEPSSPHSTTRGRSHAHVWSCPRPVHAYVKISDGCDRFCSYCAIPLIKGRYEATPPQQVTELAGAALRRGARELVLVGQDTSRWAIPGYGGLGRLLGELRQLRPAPAWLRLLYLQPEGVGEDLLEALAGCTVPYLDLPLQHASARVLRAMKREGDAASYLRLLERVRRAVRGVAVRSTFIAGFPGETENDFDELCRFVEEAGLAVAGVFPFDAQEGTAAACLPGQVPDELREARAARLAQLIDAAARPYWESLVGRTIDVLIERGCSTADGEAVGRVAQQAPDIDGRTYVTGSPARRGALVRAVVEGVVGYDLLARVLR